MNKTDSVAVLRECPFCGGEASVNIGRTSDKEFIRLNGRDTGYGVNCIYCGVNNRGIAIGYATEDAAIAAWNRRHPAPPGADAVTEEPPPGLLMSIALRLDHGLGCPGYYDQFGEPGTHARRLEMALSDARRVWQEVTGRGFYKPEREGEYAALAARTGKGEA